MFRALTVVAALSLSMAPGSPVVADERPKLLVEGKSLQVWAEDFLGDDEEKVREAGHMLRQGVFLVGASKVVLPAVRKKLAKGKNFTALSVAATYGHQARPLLDVVRSLDNRTEIDSQVTQVRIMLLDDVKRSIGRMESALAQAKIRIPKRGARTSGAFSAWVSILIDCTALGLRGDFVVPHVKKLYPPRDPIHVGQYLWFAQSLGPAAEPLAKDVAKLLEEREDDIRFEVVMALASQPNLSDDVTRKLLAATARFTKAYEQQGAMRGIATASASPKEALLTYFAANRAAEDRLVATWANAGIARLAPKDANASALRSALADERVDVRIAGAHGLMFLKSKDAADALTARLQDVDMRVRWRAAVALLKMNKSLRSARAELARIIDGPDDMERVAAFRAIEGLGTVAGPLATQLEPWAKVPFRRIAERAQAALTAVRR